jgi:hypothetical protein
VPNPYVTVLIRRDVSDPEVILVSVRKSWWSRERRACQSRELCRLEMPAGTTGVDVSLGAVLAAVSVELADSTG